MENNPPKVRVVLQVAGFGHLVLQVSSIVMTDKLVVLIYRDAKNLPGTVWVPDETGSNLTVTLVSAGETNADNSLEKPVSLLTGFGLNYYVGDDLHVVMPLDQTQPKA